MKLYRKVQDNPLWTSEQFSRGQAWIDLILLANHEDSFFYLRGVRVNVERGQVARSERTLSERWQWSRSKVRKFLNDLEKELQIKQHKNNVVQLLTVLKYDEYQKKEPQTVPQKNHRRTTERPIQECKEGKECKETDNVKINGGSKFFPPTIDQIIEYCNERQNNVDADKWLDYYTSNGWMVGKNKMKCWKAAIRTWEKNNFSHSQPKGQQLTRQQAQKQQFAIELLKDMQ